MIKLTTTKATHRGVVIEVMSDSTEPRTRYGCTNSRIKPKVVGQWYNTQSEAIASERSKIDEKLR